MNATTAIRSLLLVCLASSSIHFASAQTDIPPTRLVAWGSTSLPSVDLGTTFKAAGGSLQHTIALRVDGTVITWGEPSHPYDKGWNQVPTTLNQVVAVSAHRFLDVALKEDGSIVAWGDRTAFPPYAPQLPANWTNIIAVSVGESFCLALTRNGKVSVWGKIPDMEVTNVPIGLENVVAIAAGQYTAFALKSDGTVAAWGCNSCVAQQVPSELTNVTAIAAGFDHALALKSDGTVVAWGSNSRSQTSVPAGLTNVVAIAAGNVHSAALRIDGTVAVWGSIQKGGSPDYDPARTPEDLHDVASIWANSGMSHTVAIKKDGTLVAWGDNTFAQSVTPSDLYGISEISPGGQKLLLKEDGTVTGWGLNFYGEGMPPKDLSNVVSVAAGPSHSLALRQDGTVVAWGDNGWGTTNVPEGLTGVVAIGAGYYHSVALKNDGTLVGWGNAGQPAVPGGLTGILAIDRSGTMAIKEDRTVVMWEIVSTIPAVPARLVPVPPGLSNVIAVSAGRPFLALKSDGTVLAWGPDNSAGQLTVPHDLSNVVAIAASGNRCLALKSDGKVVCWGLNDEGQSTVPANLGEVPVAAISALENGSYALVKTSPSDVPLRLFSPSFSDATGFTLRAEGSLGLPFLLERSSELFIWKPWARGILRSQGAIITGLPAPESASQFYRLRNP